MDKSKNKVTNESLEAGILVPLISLHYSYLCYTAKICFIQLSSASSFTGIIGRIEVEN